MQDRRIVRGTLVSRTPIEIVGDQGALRGMDALNVERPIQLQLLKGGAVVETEEVFNQHAYTRQVDEFAAALEDKTPFAVPGEQGWQNQVILDAAYRSVKSGKSEKVQSVL